MKCSYCGIDFEPKRADAKTCSSKCRKDLSRLKSVTHNVTLNDPDVTLNFEFYTITKAHPTTNLPEPENKSAIRTAKYWYDVPLGAIPVLQKDWPDMPEYMNGRQYFLWWKNNFAVQEDKDKPGYGKPMIHNPFLVYDNVRYEMGGEGSRRWGA